MNVTSTETASLPPCSVAIKCADDPLIERCLDSIDDPDAAVNAVITPSPRIQSLLEERGIPYVLTEYGNIARSAQLSVETAEYDNVIVMDSDAYFAPGSVGRLRQALGSAIVAKPRMIFPDGDSYVSQLVVNRRRAFYDRPDYPANPGLALRRTELAERCRYVFNPAIRWTEDADLNYRMKKYGVTVEYVPDAAVYHDPVTLSHELRCALLYGAGKRLSVEHTPGRPAAEDWAVIAKRLMDGTTARNLYRTLQKNQSLGSVALDAVWRTVYLAGYHTQKHTGRWSLPLPG